MSIDRKKLILAELESMQKLLEELKEMIDHPATIMVNMGNIMAAANRVSYSAGRLKGNAE